MQNVQIEQIRFDLTWPIRHEVMYPDLPFDAIKLDDDPNGTHFGLYAAGQLISVTSVFNQGNSYQFRKFATLGTEQGKGYGSLLLDHIIRYVKETGGKKLWCNARVSAKNFYGRFGFAETDRRSVSNGIDFIIMELQLDN